MPKVSKPCSGCGAMFESWPNHNRKFCSRECGYAFGNGGRQVGDARDGKSAYVCAFCAATFQAWPSQAGKYCSRSCSDLARRERITFACATCGRERTVKAGRANPTYCSAECAGRGKALKPWNVCPCGKTPKMRGRTFCSRACSATANDTRVEVPCSCCGKPVKKQPLYLAKVENPCCSYRCSRAMQQFARSSAIGTSAIDAWAQTDACIWQAEYRVGWYRIDLALPFEMIAIELDGEYWHGRPEQIKRDAARDAWLTRHGWIVRRVTMRAAHRSNPEAVSQLISKAIRSARREQRRRTREVA